MTMSIWISVREVAPWLPQAPYFVTESQRSGLRNALRQAGFEIFEADANASSTERELLRSVGDALAFPDYYGANWAAFEDCLGDLLRSDVGRVGLVLVGVDNLMRSDPHAFVRCVHFLLDAVAEVERASAAFQFEVFFVGDFTVES
jgi:hypothetical protein